MFDFHVLLSLISIFIAWKWGDWRNWKLYYPTILYMIIGNLTYIILSKNKPLWKYESPIISGDFAELLIAFVVFPCTCFIFFQLYSKVNNSKRIPVYILFFLFCAFVYTSIEYLSFYLGFFLTIIAGIFIGLLLLILLCSLFFYYIIKNRFGFGFHQSLVPF
jgi:hypothetical protein